MVRCLLLVANFPRMNFTQLHERLRLELQRRIQRGSLTVSLLARQTGLGQSHLSNFLHSRRQLSLEAMDRVLAAQHLLLFDLVASATRVASAAPEESSSVPVVSHAAAMFEPIIRASLAQAMIRVPGAVLESARARTTSTRRAWQRFVAVRVHPEDEPPMEPLVFTDAMAVVDRHYTSLAPYRQDRLNLYAVRNGAHLTFRYAEFLANRLVLRPRNIGFPLELIEIEQDRPPNELLAGRVLMILNEL